MVVSNRNLLFWGGLRYFRSNLGFFGKVDHNHGHWISIRHLLLSQSFKLPSSCSGVNILDPKTYQEPPTNTTAGNGAPPLFWDRQFIWGGSWFFLMFRVSINCLITFFWYNYIYTYMNMSEAFNLSQKMYPKQPSHHLTCETSSISEAPTRPQQRLESSAAPVREWERTQNLTISFFTKIKPRTLCLCLRFLTRSFVNDLSWTTSTRRSTGKVLRRYRKWR